MSDGLSDLDDEFDRLTDDDYDDDEFGMDVEQSHSSELDDDAFVYEVLKPHDITDTQLKNISEITTLMEVTPSMARILLQRFGWDRERLIDRYYDGGDADALFKECCIVNPEKSARPLSASMDPRTCEICYMDSPASDMAGLACGHSFCKDCWSSYLKIKIVDEGIGVNISCPAHGCQILVDELMINSLITDKITSDKYHYLIAKAFVQDNKHVTWCPAPGCENAIRVPVVKAHNVTCECGRVFCFSCLQDDHRPVHCSMLKVWLKKCADDSETANWISANTKECPTCRTTIEKSGGCNHMICLNGNCRFEFCWVCLGSWEPHGQAWYNCNRYQEKDSQQAQESQRKSRQSLERYLHYYTRYANHDSSAKFENKLYQDMAQQMEQMQKYMSWIEVQFLRKAVDVLCVCRRMLKYTYVFGFYLKKNNEAHIFETNQADLENAVEALSGFLEREITEESMKDIKQKVLDKTLYCEKRRQTLMNHVLRGFEANNWEFTVSF